MFLNDGINIKIMRIKILVEIPEKRKTVFKPYNTKRIGRVIAPIAVLIPLKMYKFDAVLPIMPFGVVIFR